MFTLVYAGVSDSALQIPFLLLLIFGSATHHKATVHLEFSQKNIILMRGECGVRRKLNTNNRGEDTSTLMDGSSSRKYK